MASKFTAGMKNVVEALNEMWAVFAAGPFNALPLTGGNLTGPVSSSSSITGQKLSAGTGFISDSVLVSGVTDRPDGLVEALRLGVSVRADKSFPGFFSFQTLGGQSGFYKEGQLLRIHNLDQGSNSFSAPLFTLSGTGDVTVGRSVIGNDFFPSADSAYTVGTPARRFQAVYAVTGAISTSDARLKCDFRELSPVEIAAARDLARAIGIYRWRDAVEEKGEAAREHLGPTVQRAIEIMQSHGLDPFNYGFICHDVWERQVLEHPAVEARAAVPAIEAAPAVLDSLGNVVTAAVPASPGYPAIEARAAYTEVTQQAGDRYAFRYDELAMFISAGQEARLAAQEMRLAALGAQLVALEAAQ